MSGGLGRLAKLFALFFLMAAAGLVYTTTRLPKPSSLPAMVARQATRIVVVGSGLSGTAAALTAAEALGQRGEVVVLEKEGRAGGNSMKASSGINALTPEHGDAADTFREDTLRSGGGLAMPQLVDTLVVSCVRCVMGCQASLCQHSWQECHGSVVCLQVVQVAEVTHPAPHPGVTGGQQRSGGLAGVLRH
jgi:hypothetical protein